MRLYKAKVPTIAREIINKLVTDEDIEVTDRAEAELDIESVLNEYRRVDREITEETKDMLERRGLSHSHFGRARRIVAEQKNMSSGPDGLIWICNQILETFMHSAHVDEIFSDDVTMKRKMDAVLRKHMLVDEGMDAQVRARIKNMEEGTATWDIEYKKAMEQIKRKRGLVD